jgi:DnaJ-class molecular chaperone
MDLSKLTDDEILELIRETCARTDENGVTDLGNGWKEVPCSKCRGRGFNYVPDGPFPRHSMKEMCEPCLGRGYFHVQTGATAG